MHIPRDMRDPPVLDRAKLLRAFGVNMDVLCRLADLFIHDCPRRLEAMRTALAHHDAVGLEHVAHTFMGSAGYFAGDRAYAAAVALEALARSGDLTRAEPACAALEREIARLTRALAKLRHGGSDPRGTAAGQHGSGRASGPVDG